MTKRFTLKTTNQTTDRPKRFAPRQPVGSDFEMGMQEKRPYMMYETGQVFREVNIYISDEFAEPLQYCEMIHVIRTATPNDTIYIHLNTPGGRLDTGVQLISAIRSTEGRVVTVLDGVAHSMGALLFLCGHEMIVHDHGQLMFHTYSGGVMGKGSDIRGQTDATEDWFREIANDICHPFMSRREIQRMLRGEDFWFQTEEIGKRLEKMFEIIGKEREAEMLQAQDDEINQMIAILAERGLMVVDADDVDDGLDEPAVTHHDEDEPEELTFRQAFDEDEAPADPRPVEERTVLKKPRKKKKAEKPVLTITEDKLIINADGPTTVKATTGFVLGDNEAE